MAYQVEIQEFQGPLDLLLQFIKERKLDISQVSLAKVTDQYLNYLDNSREISASELADFLIVAAKLLVVKSKLLLPELVDDGEDGAEELETQLRFYQEYLIASQALEKIIKKKNFCFSREKIVWRQEPVFSPPAKLKPAELAQAFESVLNRINYLVNLPRRIVRRNISLKKTVGEIRRRLAGRRKISFQEILARANSREEALVSFVALLELIKNQEAAVNQKGIFDEIFIEKI